MGLMRREAVGELVGGTPSLREGAGELPSAPLGMSLRSAALSPRSIDEAGRSVEAVISTSGPTLVFDRRGWELIEEVLIMRGMHAPDQVPLLDQHSMWSIRSQLGSGREIRVNGDEALARCVFAEDDESERAWLKVRGGHCRNVSIGYMARENQYVDIAPGQTANYEGKDWTAGKRKLRVTREWDLIEVSLVVFGADPGAQIREGNLTAENTKNAERGEEIGGRENEGDDAMRWRFGVERVAQRLEAHGGAGGGGVAVDKNAEAQRRGGAEEGKEPAVQEIPGEVLHTDPGETVRAVAVERERQKAVRELCRLHGASEELETRAVAEAMTVDQCSRALLAEIQSSRAVAVPRVTDVRDGREGLARAMGAAISLRASVPVRMEDRERRDAEEFRYATLRQMCEMCVRAEGKQISYDPMELFMRAVSTISLPVALGDSAHKVLLAGYESIPSTALRVAAHLRAKDFKTYNIIVISPFSRLAEVGPAGNFEFGGMTEGANTYRVKTFARGFGITRQDVINDDLGAFTAAAQMMGIAAKLTLNANWLAQLVSNSGVGPTMAEDGKALFATDHTSGANYATGAGTVLSESGLEAAARLLASQKTLPDPEGQTFVTNAAPRYLVVPSALQFTALKWMNSTETRTSRAGTTDANSVDGTKNVMQGLAEVVPEATLDLGTNGTTAWYLFADPANPMNATLALSFLNGIETPTLEDLPQQSPFVFGKVIYHDWGIDAVGHRATVRMKGV